MPQRTTSAMLSPADTADCARYAREKCLSTGPPRLVGVELEWLVQDARDRTLPVDEERLSAALEAVSLLGSAPRVRAEPRTGRPGGAELRCGPLAHPVRRGRPRGSAGAARRAHGVRLHARRTRHRPVAAASARPAASAALPGDGEPFRLLHPGRPLHDGGLRVGPGLRGRGHRSARTRPPSAALAAGASAGPGPGGGVRQLAHGRGASHRMAVHPAGHLGAAGPLPYARGRRRGHGPAGRVGAVRARRRGDVRTERRRGRSVVPAAGHDLPSVDRAGRAVARRPHRRRWTTSPTTWARCSRRYARRAIWNCG